jgi:zinc D-Ala-D-Ala carboxypeptidase
MPRKETMDWSQFPNFSEKEMRCKHTGKCEMDVLFMVKLQTLRTDFGKPMTVNSAYRDPSHPAERDKAKPGAHTKGRAVDIAVSGADAYTLVKMALERGFTGIGVQQKGAVRYIHLDDLTAADGFPRPTIWSY